jgi:hypothetical protein
MELDDRVARVVGVAEHLLELDLGQLLGDFADLCGGFAQRLLALLVFREIEKEARLFELDPVLLPRIERVLDAGLLFEDRLRLVGVVPEIGLGGELVQLFETFLLAVEVKDASGAGRAAPRGGLAGLGFLRTWLDS